jgi:hypothetical protein
MLFFRVIAKLQPRPVPPARRGGQAAPSRRVLLPIPVIQPLCFQTLTYSFSQRRSRNPFLFNRLPAVAGLQTLFSPRRTTALNNPFGIMWFRILSSPHRTTALNNPFGFKCFHTLFRHNGGIPVFAKKFLKNHLRFPCPPWRAFLSLSASAILRTNCAPTPLFVTFAQKQGGGGIQARPFSQCKPSVGALGLRSYGIRNILCSFSVPLPQSFCSSFRPPVPQRARNGSKHSSRDCSALWGYKSDSRNSL